MKTTRLYFIPAAKISEIFRALVLVGVAAIVSWPFLSENYNGIGGPDPMFYLQTISDYVLQLRQGIFPPFVTQTEFMPIGHGRFLQGPYLFYLSGLVDFLTGHLLSFVYIQNIVIAVSVFLALFFSYFCLKALHPKYAWEALILAALYVLSPVVSAFIYGYQMYASVTVLPWLPLAFFLLVRSLQTSVRIFSILLGAILSIAWSAHPGVGMGCTLIIGLVQLVHFLFMSRNHRTLKAFLFTYLSFFFFSASFFFPLLQTGEYISLHGAFEAPLPSSGFLGLFVGRAWVEQTFAAMVNYYRLGRAPFLGGACCFSIGLAVWILLVGALITAFFRRSRYSLLFLGVFCLFFPVIVPIYGVSEYFLSALPYVFSLLLFDPLQRLVVSLLIVGIFGIYLVLPFLPNRRISLFFLIVAFVFSVVDFKNTSGYMISLRSSPDEKAYFNKWNKIFSLPENFGTGSLINDVENIKTEFFEPLFWNRVYSKEGRELISIEKILIDRCKLEKKFPAQTIAGDDLGKWVNGPVFTVQPGDRTVFGMSAQHNLSDPYLVTFSGKDFYREYTMNGVESFPTGALRVLSFAHSQGEPVEIQTKFKMGCLDGAHHCKYKVDDFCFFKYDPGTLPIRIISLLPLKIEVKGVSEASLLETHRLFYKGYSVKVNGKNVEFSRSKNSRVAVPLGPGNSIIELAIEPTLAMKLIFVMTGIGWLLLLAFAYVFRRVLQAFPDSTPKDLNFTLP